MDGTGFEGVYSELQTTFKYDILSTFENATTYPYPAPKKKDKTSNQI
jgi:hypothetical protein